MVDIMAGESLEMVDVAVVLLRLRQTLKLVH
jgi:hypothetical protein